VDRAHGQAFRLIALAVALLALVVFAFGFLISLTLPYGDWDAMAYGAWSRMIADHWPHLRFAAASAVDYHRPFFYALQGTVWRIFGFHQSLGRLLSLAFAVLLGVSLGLIAWRSVPRRYAELAAAIAVAVLVILASFERFIVSGLTDIPAAAMIALTAALLFVPRLGRARLPLVGVAACLALLTKPSVATALVGLIAAVLVGPRADLRRRLPAAGAIAAGTVIALIYDIVQARYVHLSLHTFMTTGTDGFYAGLSAQLRHDVLLDTSWLGADLRLLLTFAIAYALARVAPRSTHRISTGVALVIALVWSWLGPHLAGRGGGLVPGAGGSVQEVAVIVLAASLLFAFAAPADAVADRLQLTRLLVWVAPPLVIWAWYGVYDDRLASPAWPPLVLLMVRALLPAFAGAVVQRRLLVAFPAVALLVLAGYATENMNGLGSAGWRSLNDTLGNGPGLRSLALGGDFASELDALKSQVQPGDTIVTADGRLEFYYLSQVSLVGASSCSALRRPGRTVFMLLESDESQAVNGARADPKYWESCRTPKLTKVTERPGAFALFVTGPVCTPAAPTPGLSIEFGRFKTEAAAEKLLAQAKGDGFREAIVEQLGCGSYRVVEHGVPNKAVGESIVAEAKSAHLNATIVSGP
jgi:4-amino-4-deoxy-L-arabinose transferase-like glycosyltransferase